MNNKAKIDKLIADFIKLCIEQDEVCYKMKSGTVKSEFIYNKAEMRINEVAQLIVAMPKFEKHFVKLLAHTEASVVLKSANYIYSNSLDNDMKKLALKSIKRIAKGKSNYSSDAWLLCNIYDCR